jgi:hypothetical protein
MRVPNEAKRRAVARPIPDEPPVMRAILPCKGCIIILAISNQRSAIRDQRSATVFLLIADR